MFPVSTVLMERVGIKKSKCNSTNECFDGRNKRAGFSYTLENGLDTVKSRLGLPKKISDQFLTLPYIFNVNWS